MLSAMEGKLIGAQRAHLVGFAAVMAGHDLGAGQADHIGGEGTGRIQCFVRAAQALQQDGLAADAAADGHLFHVQKDGQVEDLHCHRVAETVQDLLRFRLPGVDGIEELAAVQRGVLRQTFAGAVM